MELHQHTTKITGLINWSIFLSTMKKLHCKKKYQIHHSFISIVKSIELQ